MLLDIRERNREVAQAQAAPAVPERAVPQPPMFRPLADFFGGAFRPAAPEPTRYEPPRPVQFFENDGNFDWIDNPSMYPLCVITSGSHLIRVSNWQTSRASLTHSPAK